MEAERNKNNSGKVLWKLMNNARKAIKNLRNRIARLANSKIDQLKQRLKPSQSLEK